MSYSIRTSTPPRSNPPGLGLWLLGLGAALATSACSDAETPESPASFNRPERVAFVCFENADNSNAVLSDDANARAVPLAECENPTEDTDGYKVLHALLTQTETGQVAAINMHESAVVDSRADVPGYTYVDVGELPIAVIVPEEQPEYTYVASATGSIGVYQTAAFRPSAGSAIRAFVQEVSLPDAVRPTSMVLSPDESTLVVSSQQTGELYVVPICDADCTAGPLLAPEAIALTGVSEALEVAQGPTDEPYTAFCDEGSNWTLGGSADAVPDAAVDLQSASFVFGPVPEWPTDSVTTVDVSAYAGVSPEPLGMTIDTACSEAVAGQGCLLVADGSLPIIHRYLLDGSALTALTPLVTGVPTRQVLVTPEVPVSLDDSSDVTHYVYALDDTDGSVLVLQDGQVLPVNADPGKAVDRLSLGAIAEGTRVLSMEIIDSGTGYLPVTDTDGNSVIDNDERVDNSELSCGFDEDDEDYGEPSRMRGVFLALGLSNGVMRFYDIHDHDMLNKLTYPSPSENTADTCRSCPFLVKRHRPRISNDLTDDEWETAIVPLIETDPTYQLGSRELSVLSTGQARDQRLPRMACIPCPEGMQRAYTELSELLGYEEADAEDVATDQRCAPGSARVCSITDPYSATGETWLLSYQGLLPGAQGLGSLAADTAELTVLNGVDDLCEVGVLGNDSGIAKGDMLTVVSVPDEIVRSQWPQEYADACATMVSTLEDGERAVAFEILEAYGDRLVLDTTNIRTAVDDLQTRQALPQTYEEVRQCYQDNPVSFLVRVQDSFVVQGAASGFSHRTVAEEGHCVLDTALPDTMRGRLALSAARPRDENDVVLSDELDVFNNGRIALALERRAQDIPQDETLSLLFSVLSPTYSLSLSLASTTSSALLQELRFSKMDRRLYLVDPYRAGLYAFNPVEYNLENIN